VNTRPHRIGSLQTLSDRLALRQSVAKETRDAHLRAVVCLDEVGVLGHVLGGTPDVRMLSGEDNEYVLVRGAGLAVFHRHVHRRLEHFFAPTSGTVARRRRELTTPLTAYP
jgi:hypothetical protein